MQLLNVFSILFCLVSSVFFCEISSIKELVLAN